MRTPFSEVLARESASLARVVDDTTLACWRRRVVEELMRPDSPYGIAMRPIGDVDDRADFLRRWRRLIAEAIDRLLRSRTPGTPSSAEPAQLCDVDAQEAAMLILAALHGGSTLSQLVQNPRPLNAALDLALAPFSAGSDAALNDGELE